MKTGLESLLDKVAILITPSTMPHGVVAPPAGHFQPFTSLAPPVPLTHIPPSIIPRPLPLKLAHRVAEDANEQHNKYQNQPSRH